MWYDKYHGTPPSGSPLESILILVFLRRKEAELLATRALVQASIPEGKAADPAIEAYKHFCDAMFPYINRAMDTELDDAKKALLEMVKKPLSIKLSHIYKQQAASMQTAQKKMWKAPKALQIKPKMPGIS